MAEAHQPLLLVEHALDQRFRNTGALRLFDHWQHPGRGAAVQRPGHRADRTGQRRADAAPVDAITRAVNVEAFIPCSAAQTQ